MKNIYQILTIGIFLISIVSCKEKVQETKMVRPVRYQKVGFLGANKVRTFSGTAITDKVINLSFRNSGIITMLDMKLGQVVKKGDLLGRLDNVQARLNYESALENLNSTESQMNTALLSLNRIRSLFEKGSSSLSDYEAAKNSYRTSVASHESSKRSVSIQEEQIRYGFLYAPEDGAISRVDAEVDENITPGEIIGVLNAGSSMQINLGLPESIINGVEKGMEVKVDFSSLEMKQFVGIVTEVSPAIDNTTSTYPVKITVVNPTKDIKSGMATNVTFNFGAAEKGNHLIAPAMAVGEDDKGQFVFLIDSKESKFFVRKKHIKIGNLTSEGFQILEGVTEGEKIATAGLQTLLDGQEVKIK